VAVASGVGGGGVWEQRAGGFWEQGCGLVGGTGSRQGVDEGVGRDGNGDDGGGLMAVMRRSGDTGEEWAPVGDKRGRRRWGWVGPQTGGSRAQTGWRWSRQPVGQKAGWWQRVKACTTAGI
jgi:hypothetical protein